MTNIEILKWIRLNLGPVITQALAAAKAKNPQLIYTEDWLAAIAMRETGGLIAKRIAQAGNLPSGRQLGVIASLMKGDYTQRKGEKEAQYHGYGFFQADIGSYPAFVKSGDWKDPTKACAFAIEVLEEKRQWLQQHITDFNGYPLDRCITAAYNCGEGNVHHVIEDGEYIDARTTDHDYSKNVWEFRALYQSL